jgi:hypothetical protein
MHDWTHIESQLMELLRANGGILTVDARTEGTYAVHLDRMASNGRIECLANGYPRATYRLQPHQLRFQHDVTVVWEHAGQPIPAIVIRTNRTRVQILFCNTQGEAQIRWVAPDTLHLLDTPI